ncbi:MAG: carboxypeptidase regulatory-like domain-containing protein [Planctomycetota bacterium]|jgi:protocatechuate 3,4-dioxygenase beta subunit
MVSVEKLMFLGVVVCGICVVLSLVLFLQDDRSMASKTEGETVAAAKAMEGKGPNIQPEIQDALSAKGEREQLTPDGESLIQETLADADQTRLGEGVLFGRIISEFGDPVHEAIIELDEGSKINVSGDFMDKPDEPSLKQEAKCSSDKEGKFRLEGLAEAAVLRLSISHPDFVASTIKVKGFQGDRRDLGDVILEMGGALSGTITREDGRGVAEANVRAKPVEEDGGSSFFSFSTFAQSFSDWMTVSEADGFYRITGIPEGKVNVTAKHPDHLKAVAKNIVISKGRETRGVDIVLPSGCTIAGIVRDSRDLPVEGATVLVEPTHDFKLDDLEQFTLDLIDSLSPVKTDADGAFLIKGLKEGRYTIRIDAPTYLPFKKEKVKTGTTDLVAVLQTGGWLAGRVLDAVTGEGVETFSISVDLGSGNIRILKGEEAAAKTNNTRDPCGAFHIEGLGQGNYSLLVQAEGYADERITDLVAAPEEGDALDVRLWEESVISGYLVSDSGEPVSEGKIALQAPGGKGDEVKSMLESEGIFLPMGDSWGEVKQTSSEEDGSFVLKGIHEGSFRLAASHDKFCDAEPLDVIIGKGEKREGLEIRLSPAGAIAGTVYDIDENPMPGARVQITSGGGLFKILVSSLDGEPDFKLKHVVTDNDGAFRVDGLEPGSYQVQKMIDLDEDSLGGLVNTTLSSVMDKDGPGAVRVHVEKGIEKGKVTEVNLYETVKGGIAGTVLAAGKSVKGKKVKLFQAGLGPLAVIPIKTALTDEDGAYLFKKLEAGKYEVSIDLVGQIEPLKESIVLKEGNIAMKDFILPAGCVTGTILDAASGNPIAGIEVSLKKFKKGGTPSREDILGSLFSGSDAFIQADAGDLGLGADALGLDLAEAVQTDEKGWYEIPYVKAGEYELTASGKVYATGKLSPVSVPAGSEVAHQDFKLVRGYQVSGKVIDSSTGGPLAFCRLACTRLEKGDEEGEKVEDLFSKEEGRFTFSGLTPGTYRLDAKWKGEETALDFSIKDKDLENLEVRL